MKSFKTCLSVLTLIISQVSYGQNQAGSKAIEISPAAQTGKCQPLAAKIPTPESLLEEGICFYHKSLAANDQASAITAIDKLQEVQRLSYNRNRQSISSFYEGLSHCAVAQDLQTKVRSESLPAKKSLLQKSLCRSIKKSRTVLGAVNWQSMLVSTPNDEAYLDARMNEMGACYSTFEAEANVCGSLDAIQPAELESLIQTTVNEVIKDQLTAEKNPIKAMFSKKTELVKSVEAKLIKEYGLLETKAGEVNSRYNSANASYEAKSTEWRAVVTKYGVLAQDFAFYMNELVRLRSLLLIGANGKSREPELTSGARDVSLYETKVAGAVAALNLLKTAVDKWETPEQKKATLKQACGIYYCSLLNSDLLAETSEYCMSNESSLCLTMDMWGSLDTESVKDISFKGVKLDLMCSNSGLLPNYRVADMGKTTATECFKTL